MPALFRKSVASVLILSLFSVATPLTAQAEVIGTLTGLESVQRAETLARINAVLAREEAREQMKALGVDEAQLEARLARLTQAELNALATRIDELPAGAGLLEVVGVVFIVLLILEAVGVTDIFTRFP